MNNSHFKLNKEILSFYSSGLRDTTNSLDHQLQLLPLLGVNLQRHLHGAVRDGLSELAVLQLLAVDGDEGVLVFPGMERSRKLNIMFQRRLLAKHNSVPSN